MRRKDLLSNGNIAPGLYLLQGDEGDPEARVVLGPFPATEQGRRTLTIQGEQMAARTRSVYSLAAVVELPA